MGEQKPTRGRLRSDMAGPTVGAVGATLPPFQRRPRRRCRAPRGLIKKSTKPGCYQSACHQRNQPAPHDGSLPLRDCRGLCPLQGTRRSPYPPVGCNCPSPPPLQPAPPSLQEKKVLVTSSDQLQAKKPVSLSCPSAVRPIGLGTPDCYGHASCRARCSRPRCRSPSLTGPLHTPSHPRDEPCASERDQRRCDCLAGAASSAGPNRALVLCAGVYVPINILNLDSDKLRRSCRIWSQGSRGSQKGGSGKFTRLHQATSPRPYRCR